MQFACCNHGYKVVKYYFKTIYNTLYIHELEIYMFKYKPSMLSLSITFSSNHCHNDEKKERRKNGISVL
jgi:hypothetical protein